MIKKTDEFIKEKSGEVANLLKTLGHPNRLLILCLLGERAMSVSELDERITTSGQSQISQFLKRMEREGLVASKRASHHVYYEIKDQRILKLIHFLNDTFCGDCDDK